MDFVPSLSVFVFSRKDLTEQGGQEKTGAKKQTTTTKNPKNKTQNQTSKHTGGAAVLVEEVSRGQGLALPGVYLEMKKLMHYNCLSSREI